VPRVLEKLESWFFYLLIFAVPFETRLIVARWAQPFNEWTAGFVYGTDILLAAIFIFWLARNLEAAKISNFKFLISKQILSPKSQALRSPSLWLFLFFAISALSIFNSRIVGLSLYQLLKLAEFIGFYFYLVRSKTPTASADAPMAHRTSNGVYLRSAFGKIYGFRNVLMVIMASGIFQAAIAIAQYFKQGSLGLRLLGESPLSVNAAGVAVFIADSHKYLRAYGTTPHPNVLAAWLFLAIFAFYNFYFYPKEKSSLGKFFLVCYPILLLGLFFTFSRVIIGLWALGAAIGVLLLFKRSFRNFLTAAKQYLVTIVVITLVTGSLFAVFFWPQVKSRVLVSAEEEAVTQRIFYNKIAESVTSANPLLGVGIGQFVPQLMNKLKHWPSHIYQPVHNIYLLISSETGLVGLALFLLFLFFLFWRFIRRADFKKPYSFSFLIFGLSFLLLGLFDHFLWTLQQGSLIFWMTAALISLNPRLD
jgi:O-antigen ligase